jgi:hypothetical protein
MRKNVKLDADMPHSPLSIGLTLGPDRLKPRWVGLSAQHPLEAHTRQWKTLLPVQKMAGFLGKVAFL